MDPVLRHHFNNFKAQFEIATEGKTPEEEKKKDAVAFEKFVNYVIFSLDYPDIFTGNIELLDFVCVGGGQDIGVDGIGIKINDRLVKSTEEVLEITEKSKKINVEFVFIQSKMRTSLDVGDFHKFGTGVKTFFTEGYLPENPQIKEFREIKDFIYSDQKVISKLDKNPSLYLYYVSIGAEPTDENFLGSLNFLKKELTQGSFYFENVDIKTIGGREIIRSCKELENKFEVQMNIIDIFPLIVDLKADLKKSYAFTCRASEFLNILKKEDGFMRRSLFHDNVRDYLGKSTVNTEMERTIVESPEMFLLCNNGITVVCTDFEQVRDKLVKIENPQIVNGCQTSNSIFNLKDHPNIEKVQLLVRLISTEDLAVSNKIVRGTNKQNLVLDELFETTLPFHQEILEPFFLTFDSDVRIYYERRAKQYNNDPLIKKTQVVNLRILTQSFVAMFLELPHEAAVRHEAKLLEYYAGEKVKRKIFNEDHSPYPYYISALTWYMFEKIFRDEKIDKKYLGYKFHLYLIFRYSLGEFPPSLVASKALESYAKKFLDLLKESNFERQTHKVLDVFDKTYRLWTSSGRNPHGIKDNKDFTKLLIEQSRIAFIHGQAQVVEQAKDELHQGQILNIIWRDGLWFGFIKQGDLEENVYFDSRGYKGDVDRLVPHKTVRYKIGTSSRGSFATDVELVD